MTPLNSTPFSDNAPNEKASSNNTSDPLGKLLSDKVRLGAATVGLSVDDTDALMQHVRTTAVNFKNSSAVDSFLRDRLGSDTLDNLSNLVNEFVANDSVADAVDEIANPLEEIIRLRAELAEKEIVIQKLSQDNATLKLKMAAVRTMAKYARNNSSDLAKLSSILGKLSGLLSDNKPRES
jgi:hypothetical protein